MRLAATALVVFALALEGCAAAESSDVPSPSIAIPAADWIPLPPARADLALGPAAEGRLEMPTAQWPAPRITSDAAYDVALMSYTEMLSGNALPPEGRPVPFGLVRRVWRPERKPARTVWVVIFRARAGFDCLHSEGGPGPCELIDASFIDDQTGARISGFGLTNGP
jgi:hypothetical protein